MQQMGNMPSQQILRATTFGSGLVLQHNRMGAPGQPFQHHPSIPSYPYQPHYYGPIPPTTPSSASTESATNLPLNQAFGPSFPYNHGYPHHSPYPLQSHQQSPQLYQQFHHSPSHYQFGTLSAGRSSVQNDESIKCNDLDGKNNSPSDYESVPVSGEDIDDSVVRLAV